MYDIRPAVGDVAHLWYLEVAPEGLSELRLGLSVVHPPLSLVEAASAAGVTEGPQHRAQVLGLVHPATTPEGIRAAVFYTKLRDQLLGPLLNAGDQPLGEHEIAAVEGEAESFKTALGQCSAVDDTYCNIVANTAAPLLIEDARTDPRAATMPITADASVGAYVGVPLTSSSGGLYGTLCCLSHDEATALGERDLQYLSVIADVVSGHLDAVEARRRARQEATATVRAVLDTPGRIRPVFQPIVRLGDRSAVGLEALSRFPDPPVRRPDE